jgi:hypothetical protein
VVMGLRGRGSIVFTKSLPVRLFLVITDSVPSHVLAGDFTGQGAAIVDGDTIEVLHNEHRGASASTASTAMIGPLKSGWFADQDTLMFI